MSDRLDRLLIQRGLFTSRSDAQAAIKAGKVSVDGVVLRKPSHPCAKDADITATRAHPYVSRAALKLAGALDLWPIDVTGRAALDIGASTGGFTEVLLQRGAKSVLAIDVGHSQFHASLSDDHRVTLHERMDARALTADHLPADLSLIVCDASFIGLEKVLVPAIDLAPAGTDLITLFKPQFQVGPDHVGKGGVVTNTDAIEHAMTAFLDWLTHKGWTVLETAPSPITGSDGNQEHLIWARKGGK